MASVSIRAIAAAPRAQKRFFFTLMSMPRYLRRRVAALLREGLGFDRCHVAVVTNIGGGDHLGLSYINTVEDLTAVKRVIVQNVTPGTGIAVLNAADPLVAGHGSPLSGFCHFLRPRSRTIL